MTQETQKHCHQQKNGKRKTRFSDYDYRETALVDGLIPFFLFLCFTESVSVSNLGRLLVVGDIRFDAKRPFDVQLVFVQLQQKHNQHKQRVEHAERENGLVP